MTLCQRSTWQILREFHRSMCPKPLLWIYAWLICFPSSHSRWTKCHSYRFKMAQKAKIVMFLYNSCVSNPKLYCRDAWKMSPCEIFLGEWPAQQAQGAFVSELFSLPTKKIHYHTKGTTRLDSCLNSAVGLFLRSHSRLISECIVCEFVCVLRCLPGNHKILILIND